LIGGMQRSCEFSSSTREPFAECCASVFAVLSFSRSFTRRDRSPAIPSTVDS
jgi:hypothetical protein